MNTVIIFDEIIKRNYEQIKMFMKEINIFRDKIENKEIFDGEEFNAVCYLKYLEITYNFFINIGEEITIKTHNAEISFDINRIGYALVLVDENHDTVSHGYFEEFGCYTTGYYWKQLLLK